MSGTIKQFCPQGHDTFLAGRSRSGRCNTCRSYYDARRSRPSRDGNQRLAYTTNLKNVRSVIGYSQAELADRSATSQPNISRLETRQAQSTATTRKKLADAMNVRPSDLVEERNKETA